MFNIEKGIPFGSGRMKYNFGAMDVGDSVFFDNEPKGSQANPVLAARSFGYCHQRKFAAKIEGDGVRVWRIE